ncbi:MAG: pyridoxamine kinase [Clostridia bacterium]|nr:pyridoxamine kinase [Clostridia bacterium]
MGIQKRAVCINDISGIGRCSITVASPILSSAGIETSVLPTALLSTHTGGFDSYSFLDLTDEMTRIIGEWKKLGITFDAIYSGYLGSVKQINTVSNFIDTFKAKNTLVMVDPVMGDSGRYYAGFTDDYIEDMKKLCGKADIIVPNMTEALFLLGREYTDGPYTEEYIKEILVEITKTGCKKAVLTGVHYDRTHVGAASYDAENGVFDSALLPRIEGFYHGTGDVFASALLACLMNGKNLAQATRIAVNFTHNSIERTYKAQKDTRYGVMFEKELPDLIKALQP